MDTSDYARWFRDSTPYISMHRNRTFVVLLDGGALAHPNLTNIVHDLALVHVLGARLVLVHGGRPQIDAAFTSRAGSSTPVFHDGRRVTRASDLPVLLGIFGELRSRLEALFSTGLPTSPLRETDIAVVSGNFVTARPVGVVDGVDHEFTGRVRHIHHERIEAALDASALVLMSPVGYSPSGQVFNLAADELAVDTALALKADKLIVFNQDGALRDANSNRRSKLSPAQLDTHLDTAAGRETPHLDSVLRASRGGIKSCQLVSYQRDGALLTELFTAGGDGTQIKEDHQQLVRPAQAADVASIVEIIRPLEEAGALVRRSRDRLEEEIAHFMVAEIDNNVVGCCAVYPYETAGETDAATSAELACVAVHPSYRETTDPSIGARLLEAAQHAARSAGAGAIFALTTQARDWFVENGFEESAIEALPAPRQALYNYQRNALVMRKRLDQQS